MFTIVCCVVLGSGLELGSRLRVVSGWLVAMHTYLYYFRLSLTHYPLAQAHAVLITFTRCIWVNRLPLCTLTLFQVFDNVTNFGFFCIYFVCSFICCRVGFLRSHARQGAAWSGVD